MTVFNIHSENSSSNYGQRKVSTSTGKFNVQRRVCFMSMIFKELQDFEKWTFRTKRRKFAFLYPEPYLAKAVPRVFSFLRILKIFSQKVFSEIITYIFLEISEMFEYLLLSHSIYQLYGQNVFKEASLCKSELSHVNTAETLIRFILFRKLNRFHFLLLRRITWSSVQKKL